MSAAVLNVQSSVKLGHVAEAAGRELLPALGGADLDASLIAVLHGGAPEGTAVKPYPLQELAVRA